MEKIKWTERFSVNIEAIDKQHKNIIQFTNQLVDAVKKGSSEDEILKIFRLLKEYSERHFKFEEDYIRENAAQLLEEQQFDHKRFMNTVNELYDQYHNEGNDVHLKLLGFLLGWIYEHILYVDKKIPKAVNLHKTDASFSNRKLQLTNSI